MRLSDLLRLIMRLAAGVVSAETSSILLFDDATEELYFDVTLTERETELKAVRLKLFEGIAGSAAGERAAVIVNDVNTDKRWSPGADSRTHYTTRSVLAVPLIYRNRLVGVIEAINRSEGEFDERDAFVMEAFAAQAAVAIVNARVFEALGAEREKLRAVFTQMSDAALLVDGNGTILDHNLVAEILFGRERCEGKRFSHLIEGYDMSPGFMAFLSGTQVSYPVEITRRQGKPLFFQGTASRITGNDGQLIGIIFVIRDVTSERRENRLKQNFLSLISHKLRTPLVAITGYCPLLLDDPALTAFQRKALSSIQRQGTHLSSLVEKLLSFAQVDREDLSLTLAPDPLGPLVSQAVESMHAFLEERDAAVEIAESISALAPVIMDRNSIVSVVRNLVENAVKFNPRRPRKVRIEPRGGDGVAGISVIDNGPGIPAEEREKAFERFYQIDDSFTGQVEGAGLGLALVKRIITAHGGRFGLENAPGGGAIAYFLLPVMKYHA